MKFKDYFNIEMCLFSPKVYYEGIWFLGGTEEHVSKNGDYLVINSKIKSGKNLYKQFLKENYYKQLKNIFNNDELSRNFKPRISFDVDEDTNKRTISFNFDYFLLRYVSSLIFVDYPFERYISESKKNPSRKHALEVTYDMIQEERKAYFDIKKKGQNSIFYNTFMEIASTFCKNTPVNDVINDFLEPLNKFCVRRNDLLEFFKQKVDTQKLLECFDFDKFCLIVAQSSIEQCYNTENDYNLVDNSIQYVKYYLDTVEKYKKINPNYDASIITYDLKGNKRKITIENIELEYRRILARHPEFSFLEIGDDKLESIFKQYDKDEKFQEIDFTTQEGAKTLENLLMQLIEDQRLAASWEFIPKGKSNVAQQTYDISKMYDRITEDEAIRKMIIGRKFFMNSNYIMELRGINNFSGYVGYIYPNGVVAFEKFYENEKTNRVARESATYFMDITNFIELSKKSKQEIIDMLKKDKTLKVKRVFHYHDMNRWIKSVENIISGADYTKEIIEYINVLLQNNMLTKESKGKTKIK